MALKYAVAPGNWSVEATWNDGTLPGNDDDVYSDGKTVTIDIDLVGSYRPARILARNRGGGTNGGTFVVNTTRQIGEPGAPVEIVGPDTGNNQAIRFDGESGTTLTIYGNVLGGFTSQAWGVNNSVSGTIAIYGNVSAGTVDTSHGARNASSGTITINGNVSGGNGNGAMGAVNLANGTITITGNVSGGTNSAAYGALNNSTGIITINGNVSGGTISNAYGAFNPSTGIITINGDLRPTATGQVAPAGYNNGTGYIQVTGDVYGGRGAAALFANNGHVRVLGNVRWDDTYSNAAAIDTSTNGIAVLQGDVLHHYGTTGLYGFMLLRGRVLLFNGANRLTAYAESADGGPAVTGNPVYHDGAARAASNFPQPSDVRNAVQYGPAFQFTGTCHVPPKEAVAAGAPVDHTVGIAVLTINDVVQGVWHTENIEQPLLTPFKVMRLLAATQGGLVSGAGTGLITIKAASVPTETRVMANVDAQGNRNNIDLNL